MGHFTPLLLSVRLMQGLEEGAQWDGDAFTPPCSCGTHSHFPMELVTSPWNLASFQSPFVPVPPFSAGLEEHLTFNHSIARCLSTCLFADVNQQNSLQGILFPARGIFLIFFVHVFQFFHLFFRNVNAGTMLSMPVQSPQCSMKKTGYLFLLSASLHLYLKIALAVSVSVAAYSKVMLNCYFLL